MNSITHSHQKRAYLPVKSQIFIFISAFREKPHGYYYGFIIRDRLGVQFFNLPIAERPTPCLLESVCEAILIAFGYVEKTSRARITIFTEIKNFSSRIDRFCDCTNLSCSMKAAEVKRMMGRARATSKFISVEDNSQARLFAETAKNGFLFSGGNLPATPRTIQNKDIQSESTADTRVKEQRINGDCQKEFSLSGFTHIKAGGEKGQREEGREEQRSTGEGETEEEEGERKGETEERGIVSLSIFYILFFLQGLALKITFAWSLIGLGVGL
jgi:hypothetical protein